MEAIDNTEKIEQVAQMLENPNIEELMPGVHMNVKWFSLFCTLK